MASFIFSIWWSTVLGTEKGRKGCSLLEIWLQLLRKKRVGISWKGQWIVEVFPEKQFIWEMTTWLNCSSHCATQSETLKPSPGGIVGKNDHFIWKLWDLTFLEVSYPTHVSYVPLSCMWGNTAIFILYEDLVPSVGDQTPYCLRSRLGSFYLLRHQWVFGDKPVWLKWDNLVKAFLVSVFGIIDNLGLPPTSCHL